MKGPRGLNGGKELGSALTFAIMIILMGSIAAAFYLRETSNRFQMSASVSGKSSMTVQVKSHLQLFRDGLQTCLDGLMNESPDPLNPPLCLRNPAAIAMSPSQLTQYLRDKLNVIYDHLPTAGHEATDVDFDDIAFECVSNCNLDTGFQGFPKQFRARYMMSAPNGSRVMLRQTFEYSRQTLNDFAQLVLEQSTPFVIAPGVYDGKMGIQWGSTDPQPDPQNPSAPAQPTPPPAAGQVVVKFNNTGSPIEFKDALLLSNMSLSNVGNYDTNNPVGPLFAKGIVPDVPRTKVSDIVQNLEALTQATYTIGDVGNPPNNPPPSNPPRGGGSLRRGRENMVRHADVIKDDGWAPPTILNQRDDNTLFLEVNGDPNRIALKRVSTYTCPIGTTGCPGPTTTWPIPLTGSTGLINDKKVAYINGSVVVCPHLPNTQNCSNSMNVARLPNKPFTILSRNSMTLMTSIVKQGNVQDTAALMVMNGDVIIPDNAKSRIDPTHTLLSFATQVPGPSQVTDVGFEIGASIIAPAGKIQYAPTVMTLPDAENHELGGIQTLGTNVVKQLMPVSKQWTENATGIKHVQGFSFKRFQYDKAGLQSQNTQFPGATIQSQGFKLTLTNETWDEQPSIATATALLPETP